MLLSLVATAFAGGRLADCDRVFDTGELQDALQSAEVRYRALDAPGFDQALATVHGRVTCVGEPLTAPTIARLHRVEALHAFLSKDPARLDRALASLLATDAAGLPTDVVPEGHPIRARMTEAIRLAAAPTVDALPKLEVGWVEVDGTYTLSIPTTRPVLLQRFDGDGKVEASWYRWPEDPLGEWGAPDKRSSKAPKRPKKVPAQAVVEADEIVQPAEVAEVEGEKPAEARSGVRLVPGVLLGVGYSSAGNAASEGVGTGQVISEAFAGSGARAAGRLELSFSPTFGVVGELGYRNLFGAPTFAGEELADREEYLLSGNNLHLGYASLGPSLRFGRFSFAAAPLWAAGGGVVTGVDPGSLDAAEHPDPDDAAYQRVTFDVKLGGAMARADFDVVQWPGAALAIEVEGGAATTGLRTLTWASAGVTLSGRRP